MVLLVVDGDLKDFVQCCNPTNRHERDETVHRKPFKLDASPARDNTNLDTFWLKNEDLEASENMPSQDVLAQEIVEDLDAALEAFRRVEERL